jgi:hypothetical protein
MNRLPEFLQEDDGGFSATRLAFLLWVGGVLIVWIIDSLSSKTLERIDPTVTTIIGILMTGKVVQKFGEKPCAATNQPNLFNQATTERYYDLCQKPFLH